MARNRKHLRNQRLSIRPELMLLEDRCVPAIVYPISGNDYDPNSILVRFNSVASANAFTAANKAALGTTDSSPPRFTTFLSMASFQSSGEVADLLLPGLRVLTFDGSHFSVSQIMNFAANQDGVLAVEPDYMQHATATIPNDTNFGGLWGMNNTGQTIQGQQGTADADIDAPEAWDISKGSGNFVIAVIDTGVDYSHSDLAANIWSNPGEIPGDGIDNDGNGFVDDVHGWDFVNNNNAPLDDNNHGTHTAGTIGAVGNNGNGVVGVNWNVKIMPLKFLGAGGSGTTADAIKAVNYAVKNGAKISSNSWGGGPYDAILDDVLSNAATKGHLFIAAAGNGGSDNDLDPFYPASYDSPNVIAVAATDNKDKLAGFSQYGATSVDLAAPGVNILSTKPNNSYQFLSGTSMATPAVAGAAALIWDFYPQFTYTDVIRRLFVTVDKIASLTGVVATGGRLNVYRALSNTAPTGQTDTFNMNQGLSLTVPAPLGVLANDSDAEADPFTAQLVTGPSNGTLTLNPDGSFVYTPNVLFFGTDTFTYSDKDFGLTGSPVTVTINVAHSNVAPVSLNDGPGGSYLARPGVAINVASPGVLANDYDPDGPFSGLTAVKKSNPTKGSVVLNPDGSFVYTPNANASGNDSFTYVAFDGSKNGNLATVTIHLNRLSSPLSSSWITKPITNVSGNVLAGATDPDFDPLTAQLITAPTHGSFSLSPTGNFSYTPSAGFAGQDTFTFVSNDGWENSNPVTVNLRVDRLPVASSDSFTVNNNSVLEVFSPGVLANDVDGDNTPIPVDALHAQLVSSVIHGTLIFDQNGYFHYTPNPNFFGTDSFTYQVNDGLFNGNTVSVILNVKATPTANPDGYSTNTASLIVPKTSGLLVNDSSPNSSLLTARLVNGPAHGQVIINPDGSFNYQTFNGFLGVDTFTYVTNDGLYDSDPATVTIGVFHLNRLPTAKNDSYSTSANTTLSTPPLGVLANDTDPDNDQLVATLVAGTRYGNLLLNFDGSFVYTPQPNFNGVDKFTYRTSDGQGLSANIATVEIIVGTPVVPTSPNNRIILGQDKGGTLKVFAGETGALVYKITPYGTYSGGIRVATGDVNGDGTPDIITAPGPQASKTAKLPVRVFDGKTGAPLPGTLGIGFYPFNTATNTYIGGVQVAAGDVNGDGRADIVASADSNPGTGIPSVRSVNGATGTVFTAWYGGITPYTGTSFVGVRVAVGDVNGDGRADIVTAPIGGTTSAAGTQTVKVYNPKAANVTVGLIRSFNPYTTNVAGGVFLAVGDLDGDGNAEIVTGAATNANGQVRIFSGATGAVLKSFSVPGSTSGPARVAIADVNGDGTLDLVVGITTPGSLSKARVYDYATLAEMLTSNVTYGDSYTGGLFTAALGRIS
ncbi:MAG TPA: Ig-like domain-containing protein [Gemmatales bacterium]|nr:Ig-like domain-containing protein [Gemmatales bacterium]